MRNGCGFEKRHDVGFGNAADKLSVAAKPRFGPVVMGISHFGTIVPKLGLSKSGDIPCRCGSIFFLIMCNHGLAQYSPLETQTAQPRYVMPLRLGLFNFSSICYSEVRSTVSDHFVNAAPSSLRTWWGFLLT